MDILRAEHGEYVVTIREVPDLDHYQVRDWGTEYVLELPSGFVDDFVRMARHVPSSEIWRMLTLWAIDLIQR